MDENAVRGLVGRPVGAALAALIALPALTFTSSARAYKTLSDTADFSDAPANSVVWRVSPVPYLIHDDVPDGLRNADVEAAVVSELYKWEQVGCASIAASNNGWTSTLGTLGDGVNTIGWVHNGWGLDPAVGAHTDLLAKKQDGRWAIVEADILLNAEDFRWTLDATPVEGTKELRSILLHEFGHLLGLAHACAADEQDCSDGCADDRGLPLCSADPEQDAVVMNPVYDAQRLELTDDDRAGICALYPKPVCDETGCPNGFECVSGDCLHTCGDSVCPKGELCTGMSCGPIGTALCSVNTDCGVGEFCEATGRCGVGSASVGAECEEDADCRLGSCDAAGVCRAACAGNDGCDAEETCAEPLSQGAWGTCQGNRLPFGSECDTGADCLSGECLTGVEGGDVCTQTCDGDALECPNDWRCADTAGKQVCIPLSAAGGACSMTPSGGTSRGFWMLAASLLLLRGLRSRQRRSSRSFSRSTAYASAFGSCRRSIVSNLESAIR